MSHATPSPPISAKTFPRFPLLPPEIQEKIWWEAVMALPGRNVDLWVKGGGGGFASLASPPGLLFACRRSRGVARRVYSLRKGGNGVVRLGDGGEGEGWGVYLDAERDTLVLMSGDEGEVNQFKGFIFGDGEKGSGGTCVKKVAVQCSSLEKEAVETLINTEGVEEVVVFYIKGGESRWDNIDEMEKAVEKVVEKAVQEDKEKMNLGKEAKFEITLRKKWDEDDIIHEVDCGNFGPCSFHPFSPPQELGEGCKIQHRVADMHLGLQKAVHEKEKKEKRFWDEKLCDFVYDDWKRPKVEAGELCVSVLR